MRDSGRHAMQGGAAVADLKAVYLPLMLVIVLALAGGFWLIGVTH